MVITKLYNFATHQDGVTKEISIEEEVAAFRSKHNIEKPIIAVDFNACLRVFTKHDAWQQLYGGQSTVFTSRAKTFCKKMEELGAKLVFFLIGPKKMETIKKPSGENQRKYQHYQTILQKLHSGNFITESDLNRIEALGNASDCVRTFIKDNYEHRISLGNYRDMDIGKYATKNNALAVFTNDTNFLAMPGDWDVWYTNDFDIHEMRVEKIDKTKLRSALRLSPSQMPIFATFCGNDFMNNEMVNNFIFVNNINSNNRHIAIAKFIRDNSMDEPDAKVIAQHISKNCSAPFQEILDCVQKSLKFYSCESPQNIPTPADLDWLLEFTRETLMTFVYTVKMKLPLYISLKMIDLQLTEFTPFAQLIVPIIRRLAGITLADETTGNPELEIRLKHNHLVAYTKYIEYPEFPPFETPPIKTLVGKDPLSTISEDVKIEIFSWMIFKDKDVLKPPKWTILLQESTIYFLPIVKLYYLVKKKQIEIFEADAMLLSMYQVVNNRCDRRNQRRPKYLPTARAAWLAFSYPQMNYFFQNALTISGFGKYLKMDYFDGYVYHSLYDEMDRNIQDREVMVADIEELRLYVNQ